MPPNRRWKVELTNEAERSIDRIRDRRLLARLNAALDGLEVEPRPQGCIKLSGHQNLYRIRVGDWRITYAIHDAQLIVVVVEIEPRGRAYRNL
jgi:mRNA interferase RelE/StbE